MKIQVNFQGADAETLLMFKNTLANMVSRADSAMAEGPEDSWPSHLNRNSVVTFVDGKSAIIVDVDLRHETPREQTTYTTRLRTELAKGYAGNVSIEETKERAI